MIFVGTCTVRTLARWALAVTERANAPTAPATASIQIARFISRPLPLVPVDPTRGQGSRGGPQRTVPCNGRPRKHRAHDPTLPHATFGG